METRPYNPSWIDRVFDWIDSLPFHPAFFYAGLYLYAVLSFHIAYWIAVPDQFGSILGGLVRDAVWILGPAYLHYLRSLSRKVVDDFSLQIDASADEKAVLRYRFVYMPPWPVLIGAVIAFALVFYTTFDDAIFYFGVPDAPLISILLVGVVASSSYALLPILLYYAVRQLALVRESFATYAQVNIFHLEPLYGLTTITVNVAMMVIVFMGYNIVTEVIFGLNSMRLETVVFFSTVMTMISAVCFILPLLGIHDRIEDAKRDAMGENGEQIEELQGRLYKHVRAEEYDKLAGVQNGLDALFGIREKIEKVPTWPWRPGTPRNFVSAVLLPLTIWAVQQFAERFF